MVQQRMQAVDLSLAVSYVPAALCFLRLLVYLVGVTCLHPGEEIGGLLILGNALYLDRLAFSFLKFNTIFDSSAVLLSVFFSHVYLFIRNANTDKSMSFMGIAVNLWWALCCLVLILEPSKLRQWAEEKGRLFELCPPLIMAISLIALSKVHADREDTLSRFARSITFALLSVAWVYVVAIKKKLPPDQSSHFISRFSPVLYLPSYVCGIFAFLAMGGVGYQYYVLYASDMKQEERHVLPVTAPLQAIQEDGEPDMEEMFRLARQTKQN